MAGVDKASPPEPHAAEDYLGLALTASTPAHRARMARAGLAIGGETEIEPDTRVLLLRQLYLAQLEQRQLRRAAEVARQMASIGPLRDVAHNDAARALFALGETREAIEAQRLAARAAPADRRSFQFFCLATLQHFAGDAEGALTSLRRAGRWARGDRPLIAAHAAYIRLDTGRAVHGLDRIVATLQAAKCREGYGQYLLGMLHYAMGDRRRAAVHLRAFLRRNAAADLAKTLTLREELRRARLALATIESS